MFYPPTCVGLRYGRRRPCLGVFLGTWAHSLRSVASSGASPSRGPDFPGPRAALHHGDVQNPAEPPQSVAPSVVTARLRCRNVNLLRVGYAFRPRLSPRLTLGGLASPRKPRVYGGRVTLSSLATHASILAPQQSTVGDPPASPRWGRSPTDDNRHPALRYHA